MAATATVHYHQHSPLPQSFYIDADGIKGNLRSPALVPTSITLRDGRTPEYQPDFDKDGLVFLPHTSAITRFDERGSWKPDYEAELEAIVRSKTGAKDVLVFDHTLRIDDATAQRQPARNVHGDYSPSGARQRLDDLLGKTEARAWAAGHYAFLNIWRPVGAPVNQTPLAFVRPSTVRAEDQLLIGLHYPNRKGQILGLVWHPDQEWVYLPQMRPDEIALFTVFDNLGKAPVLHAAVDYVENPALNRPRQSIESRLLVRFNDPTEGQPS